MNQCSPAPAAKLYLKSKSSLIPTARAGWRILYGESKLCKFCLGKKVAKVWRQALGTLMQTIRSNKAVIDYCYLLQGFIVCHTLWGIYLLIVNWSVEAQLVLSLLI